MKQYMKVFLKKKLQKPSQKMSTFGKSGFNEFPAQLLHALGLNKMVPLHLSGEILNPAIPRLGSNNNNHVLSGGF